MHVSGQLLTPDLPQLAAPQRRGQSAITIFVKDEQEAV